MSKQAHKAAEIREWLRKRAARRKNPKKEREAALEEIAEQRARDLKGASPALDSREKMDRVDSNLATAAEQMCQWGDVSADEIEKRRAMFDKNWADYERAVGRAIRAERFGNPYVQAWMAGRRSLRDWTALRKYRLGLERGVKKEISKEDFFVAFEAGGLIEWCRQNPQRKKYKPEAIRRSIINKLLISKPEHWFDLSESEAKKLRTRLKGMSRQNFHKLLRRLHVL